MLIKNLKRLNIFSYNVNKKYFPRVNKSSTNPSLNLLNNTNTNIIEEGNSNRNDDFEITKEKNFSTKKLISSSKKLNMRNKDENNNNYKKKIDENLNSEISSQSMKDDNIDNFNFNLEQLPEFKSNNVKKLIKSKSEKSDINIRNNVSKLMEKISDPSDEDAHMTGEEVDEIDYDSYFDLYSFARINDKLPHIPQDIQDMAKKVFSKHSYKDIRFWTEKFLLNYSQNHACEPPINLSNLPDDSPLLANSEELNIKVKLFRQLDKISSQEDKKINPSNNANEKGQEDNNNNNKVILDKHHTIDLDDQRKLNKEKENVNPIKVEYNPASAVAYLFSRMPYSYQVCKRVLNEVLFRMPDFKPKSVLDFGAGLGSAVWAAFHTYDPLITKYAAVEPNRDMRRLGKFLTSTLSSEILWVESITMIPGAGIERGKFDIIFLSHVLQEIPTSKLRLMILETLWNRLSNNGVLIVIEPGSPKGFRFITDIRKWVIEKGREDANIIAPCPHHDACPLAEKSNTWCHFSQLSYKYDKDVITKTQKEKQVFNEKFCYLTIKKGKIPSNIYKKESEAKTPEEKSFFWERIVRPIISKHQHRIVDLCTKNGKFERRIISKSHGGHGGYRSIKRFNWGDLWYVPLWLPNKFRKERLRGKRLW